MSGWLLERESELAALNDLVARALLGQGGVGLVEGHAGVGKTGLLDVVAARYAQSDTHVLRAQASEAERGLPFGVVLQLFERVVAEADGEALFDGAAGLAAGLVLGLEPNVRPTPEEGVLPVVHGLFWLTSNLAESRPVLLVVDDVHWADEPSRSYLTYLARRIAELPIALLMSWRSGEPGNGEAWAADVRAIRGAETISLTGLTSGGARVMVGRIARRELSEQAGHVAWELTRGNPYLLRELALGLRERLLETSSITDDDVRAVSSGALTRRLQARLAQAGEVASKVAFAVAVLGDRAQAVTVASVLDVRVNDVLEVADVLAHAEILAADGGRLSFVHPLVRAAVYQTLGPGARATLHGRAARALLADHVAPLAIGQHLLRTPPGVVPEAAAILERAAMDAMAAGDQSAAIPLLRRALAERLPDATHVELLRLLGRTETSAGEPAGVETLRAALPIAGTSRQRAEIYLELSRAHFKRGDAGAALRAAESGLVEAEAVADSLRRELYASRALSAFHELELQEQGLRVVDELLAGDQELTPTERNLLALAALQRSCSIAIGHEEAVAMAMRAYGDGRLLELETSAGDGPYLVTGVLVVADRYREDIKILDLALEDSRRRGSALGFSIATYCRIMPLIHAGRVRDAIEDTQDAINDKDAAFQGFLPAYYAYFALGWIEYGDRRRAQATLDLLDRDDARFDGSIARGPYAWAEAELALREGRLADAEAHAQHVRELMQFVPNPSTCAWRSTLAQVRLHQGRRPEASALAEEELELAQRWGAPRGIAVAKRTLALATGGPRGLAELEEALAIVESSEARLEHAHVLVELGAALRRAGRVAPARSVLGDGLELAHRCGALYWEQRARSELTAAGGRPRRWAASGVDALTPSESRVARLVATGMTNREVAQSLFVTIKAVEKHLGAVYAKLGIGGRNELADAINKTSTDAMAPGDAAVRSEL